MDRGWTLFVLSFPPFILSPRGCCGTLVPPLSSPAPLKQAIAARRSRRKPFKCLSQPALVDGAASPLHLITLPNRIDIHGHCSPSRQPFLVCPHLDLHTQHWTLFHVLRRLGPLFENLCFPAYKKRIACKAQMVINRRRAFKVL